MREGSRGENKEKEVSKARRGRRFTYVGVTSEGSMTRWPKVIWEQGNTLFSFCCLHCCDINSFDFPQLLIKTVTLSIGVSIGFSYLLSWWVLFVFVKMKEHTISMSGLIWYGKETAHRGYYMIHIYNEFSRNEGLQPGVAMGMKSLPWKVT